MTPSLGCNKGPQPPKGKPKEKHTGKRQKKKTRQLGARCGGALGSPPTFPSLPPKSPPTPLTPARSRTRNPPLPPPPHSLSLGGGRWLFWPRGLASLPPLGGGRPPSLRVPAGRLLLRAGISPRESGAPAFRALGHAVTAPVAFLYTAPLAGVGFCRCTMKPVCSQWSRAPSVDFCPVMQILRAKSVSGLPLPDERQRRVTRNVGTYFASIKIFLIFICPLCDDMTAFPSPSSAGIACGRLVMDIWSAYD